MPTVATIKHTSKQHVTNARRRGNTVHAASAAIEKRAEKQVEKPIEPPEPPKKSLEVTIKACDLFAAGMVASKDESRHAITQILVEVSPDKYRIVATDTYSLVKIDRNLGGTCAGSFYVDPNLLRHLNPTDIINVKIVDDITGAAQYKLRVEIYNRHYKQVGVTETAYHDTEEYHYPKYEQLYCTGEPASVSFGIDADKLNVMTKAIKKVFGSKQPTQVTCYSATKPIEFVADDGKVRFDGLIMPVRIA